MFLEMRDLSYLKGGIRNFNEKWERDSGLNVCMECGMPKISIEIRWDCAKIWISMTGFKNLIGDPQY